MGHLLTASLLLAQATAAAPEHPARVVIIGVDGVSLNMLEPYIEAGVTPVMGQLTRDGARGHLDAIWPLRTPQVWTSAVTGKLPGQHGIWDHLSNTFFNPPEVRTKKKIRVTSQDRKSRALWNILAEKGHRVLTVGWMASWPAEKVGDGVMVAPVELMGDKRQTTIKGSFYSDAPRMVQPKRLEKRVRKLIIDPGTITDADLKPFADIPAAGSKLYDLKYLERYVYGLRWSLARAQSVERITLDLVAHNKPDVVLSYFQCTDSLLHRFWIFHKSPDDIRVRLKTHGLPDVGADELHRRFGQVVEACYRDVDARIGKLLDATRGPDTLVLLISDHGFGHAPVPHKLKGEPYSGDHLDEGVILAVGPGINGGSELEGANILDITPTVLTYLGYPIGADMRGKNLPALTTGKNVTTIPTYESTPQLDAPYADGGWPPRKIPPRSAVDQLAEWRRNKGAH